MKKYFAYLTLGLLLSTISCVREQLGDNSQDFSTTKTTFRAVYADAAGIASDASKIASDASKTVLNEANGKVSWAVGDAVKFVWELDKTSQEAVSDAIEAVGEDGSAEFTAAVPSVFKEKTEEEYKDGNDSKSLHLYAAYPASVEVDYSNASDFILTVPSVQDGSFASASIALAKWNKNAPAEALAFKNLCGLLQVNIADDNAKKLVITSSTDIAGRASITFPDAGPKVKAMKEALKSISVALNGAGTYYVAVYPGELKDVYVEVFDASDKLIGDRVANNSIPVERSMVRKLGTVGTGFSDRFYVKAGGEGDKSGSSWDNAADIAELKTQLAKNETKKVYIAAGTYSTKSAGELNIKGGNYSIYGGYPATATGYAINNRNVVENEVILDGGHSAEANGARILVINPGNVLVDGVTFQNAYSTNTSGSAIVIAGAAETLFNQCKIRNNSFNNTTNPTGVAGVVRVSGTSNNTFNNCVFEGNSTNAMAGVLNQYANAKLNLNNCEFYSNTSGHFGGVIYTIGELNINGCTFGASGRGNSTTSRGGVIAMSEESKVNIVNTTFAYNSGAIGGALYVDKITDAASLIVTNTIFANNTTTDKSNGGGAVGISGDSKSYAGMLKFEKVLFDANTTPSCGGAVWANGASVSFTDCSFTSNAVTGAATSENGLGGGAIYSASSAATKIFFDRCFFANNAVNKKVVDGTLQTDNATKKWGHHLDINSSTAYLGMNNCVIRAPWGITMEDSSNKGIGSLIMTRALTAIVNTTLYSRTGNPMIAQGSTTEGGCSFINVIAVNAAGTPNVFYNHDTKRYQNLDYTLYTKVKDGIQNFTETNSLSGVTYSDLEWAKDGNGTSVTVDDVRDHFYVYDWSGSLNNDKTFTKPTFEQVKTALTNTTNVGSAFLEWLGEDNLKIDIRKQARDTQAMWPGSYQGTVSANVENLNLK